MTVCSSSRGILVIAVSSSLQRVLIDPITLHFGRPMQPIANISALAVNLLQDFLAAQDVEPMITLPFDVQTLAPS